MTMLEAGEVDALMYRVPFVLYGIWISLVTTIYLITPDQSVLQPLEGLEREVPFCAIVALLVILAFYCMPFISVASPLNRSAAVQQQPSGIIVAALSVVSISILTNVLLAFFPTLVIEDPIAGSRVFLLRWCEWVPLAGVMTFMSEAVDTKKDDKRFTPALLNAFCQFASAACGIVFPYCRDEWEWGIVCTFSFLTYFPIFWRVHNKWTNLQAEPKGVTVLEKETYNRRVYAYNLIYLCCIIWTVLVAFWTINILLHAFLPVGNFWRSKSASMIFDTTFDVLAKGLYMRVIVEVHKSVFDSEARTQRQFQELRKLMKVLWDSTTDTIVISVRGRDRTSSVLSPSCNQTILGEPYSESGIHEKGSKGILIHTSNDKPSKILHSSYIDSQHITPTDDAFANLLTQSKETKEVSVAMDLIESCWEHLDNQTEEGAASGDPLLIVQEIQKPNGETCACEIKLSRRPDSFVAIFRDVTERVKRFQAEQRATAEALARQKDAQSVNRFTRHEIKNGLLAGIELCDRLRLSFQAASNNVDQSVSLCMEKGEFRVIESEMIKTAGMIGQVDRVLHEVLETVLAEAMARDVIYEIYKPSPQKVDLVDAILSSGGGVGVEPRFPLVMPSYDVPSFLLDTHLLRYIHRNAISNATKYGRVGGTVTTRVHYDQDDKKLTIEVVNEPGQGHKKLLGMGDEACAAVFQQSKRLHGNSESGDSSLSSGDGAWIMQKCAKNMGGHCMIAFEPEQTIFTFECYVEPLQEPVEKTLSTFEIPHNTWAIGVDDSWIQRKLLLRIFSAAGIQNGRKKVIGRNPGELDSVGALVGAILDEDPDSKILILIDENLDFTDDQGARTIRSGSKLMQGFLESMPSARRDRILALVRSANDSSGDVALYKQRTDGFFPKMATKKDAVMEIIEQAWIERFGEPNDPTILSQFGMNEEGAGDESISRDDLREVVSSVDTLLNGRSYQEIPWTHLWSALHGLKGDIMISENPKLVLAAQQISSMRGSKAPDDFDVRWKLIRSAVMEGIDQEPSFRQLKA